MVSDDQEVNRDLIRISELKKSDDYFIVAVSPKYKEEINNNLKENEIYNVINLDRELYKMLDD